MRAYRPDRGAEPRARLTELVQEDPVPGWGQVFDPNHDLPESVLEAYLAKANTEWGGLSCNPFQAADLLLARPDLRGVVRVDPAAWDLIVKRATRHATDNTEDFDFANHLHVLHQLFPERRTELRQMVEQLSAASPNNHTAVRHLMAFGRNDVMHQPLVAFVARLLYPERVVVPDQAQVQEIFDSIADSLKEGSTETAALFGAYVRLTWPELRDQIPFRESDFAAEVAAGLPSLQHGPGYAFALAAISADTVAVTPEGDVVITPRVRPDTKAIELPQRTET